MNRLLLEVHKTKWAILPESLNAIVAIVNNHEKQFDRSMFHQGENSIQADIGAIGKPLEGFEFVSYVGAIAILHIDGAIIPRATNSISAGATPNLKSFKHELDRLEAMESIKNVVFAIDSGGGAVTGVSEFGDYVANYSKPIVTFVSGYAASAAYWIASQTNKIYMSNTSEVGSIGTVATWYDGTEAIKAQGFTKHEIVSNLSPNKRLDASEGEGRADLIEILDAITSIFVADVAKGRNTTSENVLDKFGKGKMFIASKAIALGMADEITTLESLVNNLNKQQPKTQGVNIMPQANKDATAFTAADVKANTNVFAELKKDIIDAEHTRLKGIEALTAKDPKVASVVDAQKYNVDATKESIAFAIFNDREAIETSALKTIVTNGTALETKLAEIDNTKNAENPTDDKSAFCMSAAKEEADKQAKKG